jgi:hypothetical protein
MSRKRLPGLGRLDRGVCRRYGRSGELLGAEFRPGLMLQENLVGLFLRRNTADLELAPLCGLDDEAFGRTH